MLHAHLVVAADVQPYGIGVLPHRAPVPGQHKDSGRISKRPGKSLKDRRRKTARATKEIGMACQTLRGWPVRTAERGLGGLYDRHASDRTRAVSRDWQRSGPRPSQVHRPGRVHQGGGSNG